MCRTEKEPFYYYVHIGPLWTIMFQFQDWYCQIWSGPAVRLVWVYSSDFCNSLLDVFVNSWCIGVYLRCREIRKCAWLLFYPHWWYFFRLIISEFYPRHISISLQNTWQILPTLRTNSISLIIGLNLSKGTDTLLRRAFPGSPYNSFLETDRHFPKGNLYLYK